MNTDSRQFGGKYSESTEDVIYCFYRVYNTLGPGFLESVYENALCIELRKLGIEYKQQAPLTVLYEGQPVGEFRADLIVDNCVVVELKAARAIEPAFEAQVLNYLRATDMEVGLLLNFGPKPEFRRLIFDNDYKSRP